MSIHTTVVEASTRQHAQLLRDDADARKKRRGAAQVVALHHGRELVAILSRGGCPAAVADGERLVQACAAGEPTGGEIASVLARLDAILRQGRVTAPGHVRAATHRARVAALHALTVRIETLESVLAVTQLTEEPRAAGMPFDAQTAINLL